MGAPSRSKRRPREDVTQALRGVRRLVETLQASARAVERRTGITNAQLFVLRAIAGRESLSIGELAELARVQQSAASLVVRRLVVNGLVVRRRAPEDSRRVLLSLSPRGRKLVRHAPVPPPTARLLEALRLMAPGERRALVRGLQALERRLGAGREEPAMLFESGTRLKRAP